MAQGSKKNITIQQVLTALLDHENVFPPVYYRQFSDLEGADVEALRSVWPQVSTTRRVNVMEDLEELNDSDTIVLFDEIAKIGLTDTDPRVRVIALRLLWENSSPELAKTFLGMLRDDPAVEVRAGAAYALGNYVYLGELEEISETLLRTVEDRLLATLTGKDETLVRRRALEALGFSSREDVDQQIEAAFQQDDSDWKASALFAMGRSADNQWAPAVMQSLRSDRLNILLEAVRAAGELELQDARRLLLQIAAEEMQDNDVRAAAYWSLSKIGGEEVREAIEQRLEETEDEEEAEYLEGVLDNLSFTEDFGLVDMFDFDKLGEESDLLEENPDVDEPDRPDSAATPPARENRKRHNPKRS